MANRIEGVYALTPDCESMDELREKVGAALAGGVRLVQYRNKTASVQRRKAQATMLAELTREAGAMLIVNDDPYLAAHCEASGVHLGRDDGDMAEARQILGPSAVIGVSCYGSVSRAAEMQAAGADYVAFGSFFPSLTKPGAGAVPLSLLDQARRQIRLPIVAIGGIGPGNAHAVFRSGANAIAVITSLFGASDITAAARQLACIAAQAADVPPFVRSG